MVEGYYWISYREVKQVAFFSHEITEDMLTGEIVTGVWYLTRDMPLCNNEEVTLLSGCLSVPD